jgi:hypothetical protein
VTDRIDPYAVALAVTVAKSPAGSGGTFRRSSVFKPVDWIASTFGVMPAPSP